MVHVFVRRVCPFLRGFIFVIIALMMCGFYFRIHLQKKNFSQAYLERRYYVYIRGLEKCEAKFLIRHTEKWEAEKVISVFNDG